MKLSFLLDSAEGAGCLCRMTAQDGTATLSLTPPVYDGAAGRPNLPFRWRWWQWSGGARLIPTRRWT